MGFFPLSEISTEHYSKLFSLSDDNAKIFCFPGLLYGYYKSHGSEHYNEASEKQILLASTGVYPRLKHHVHQLLRVQSGTCVVLYMRLLPVTCLNPVHFSAEMRGADMNVFFFLQPGDGIVFMAQTLEKLCQEKLTLMPKPECEAKGRKMSEDIEQHILGQMSSSSLKCPQNPLIVVSTWIFTAWENFSLLLSRICLNGDTVHFCLLSRRCNKAAVSGF